MKSKNTTGTSFIYSQFSNLKNGANSSDKGDSTIHITGKEILSGGFTASSTSTNSSSSHPQH